jgi:hypothetical protein
LDKEYFSNIAGLSFKVLKITPRHDDVYNDEEIIDEMMELILHGSE